MRRAAVHQRRRTGAGRQEGAEGNPLMVKLSGLSHLVVMVWLIQTLQREQGIIEDKNLSKLLADY